MSGTQWIAGKNCPLCGGEGVAIGEKDGHVLRECNGITYSPVFPCDPHPPILLSWQWESVAALERMYYEDDLYHSQCVAQEGGYAPMEERDNECLVAGNARINTLLHLYGIPAPGLRFLDVGCGTGALVKVATQYGYEAYGIEPSATLVNWAQAHGRRVSIGTWQRASGAILWSFIFLTDVMEHLVDPIGCLRYMRAIMADDGVCVLEVPEWDCGAARSQGVQWVHCKPLQHLAIPSVGAAEAMINKAGLYVDALVRPRPGGRELSKMVLYCRKFA